MMLLPQLPKMPKGNFYQNAISGFGFATGVYVASFVFVPLLELVIDAVESRLQKKHINDSVADKPVDVSDVYCVHYQNVQDDNDAHNDENIGDEVFDLAPQESDEVVD